MGTRREPRLLVRLPLRIFGTDANGRAFSENVFTADISRHGARLEGVIARALAGEIVGVSYGAKKGRFRVEWLGERGTPRAGQMGLSTTLPHEWTWDANLPPDYIDNFKVAPRSGERRRHPRMQCVVSIQLQAEGETAPIWAKAIDMSNGGCFIEMPVPLKRGGKVKIAIWIKDSKLWIDGKIASGRPGFGVGVQFAGLTVKDELRLTDFLKSLP
jgi:PilZ domain.